MFAFFAMLPHFMDLRALTNSQAGWISGLYFAGYSIAVPVLTSLTDRIDSRKIYLASCFVSMIANLGFGLFSQGFRTAIALFVHRFHCFMKFADILVQVFFLDQKNFILCFEKCIHHPRIEMPVAFFPDNGK